MPNGFPYGNAFLVNTPALDQLSNRVYAEQQQRDLQRRQDNKMLDEEFSRNLSGIWDADIPELTKQYSEYKRAWQDLYKKKGGGTPEEQLDVLKKKADMYSTIGRSKEHRQWWEGKVKTIQSDKKGLFKDDAPQQLSSIRGLPSSKVDRDAIENNLLYPYSIPDFDKINKDAVGTLIERRSSPVQSKTDPLKDEVKVYKISNTPNQQFDKLLNTVVSKNLSRNFTGLVLHSMTDNEKQDLINRYETKIQDPKFIEAYGQVQPFSPTALSTDLGQAVALQTMKNILDSPIPEPKIESAINAERKKKRDEDFSLQKQQIGFNNSMKKMREYFARIDASEVEITRKAEEIKTKIDGLKDDNGYVNMDDGWKEKFFNTKTGKIRINSNGDYERVVETVSPDGKKIDEVKNVKPKEDVLNEIRGEVKKSAQKFGNTNTQQPKPSGSSDWKSRAKKVN